MSNHLDLVLTWIEVSTGRLIDIETQQEVTLHDYPPQAAQYYELEVPSHYDGKVILVTGLRQDNQIYSAEIKGSLCQ